MWFWEPRTRSCYVARARPTNRAHASRRGAGVSGNVLFVDRYVTRTELGTWLKAADIFVTPYPNPDQIVSGTLAYAMSARQAVVSTPYAYAVEMLDAGRGRLVAARLSKDFAEVLSSYSKTRKRGANSAGGRTTSAEP